VDLVYWSMDSSSIRCVDPKEEEEEKKRGALL